MDSAHLTFKRLLDKADGLSGLARALSTKEKPLSRQAVYAWRGRVPERLLERIEELYGIQPWNLRPDLYRPRTKKKPAK